MRVSLGYSTYHADVGSAAHCCRLKLSGPAKFRFRGHHDYCILVTLVMLGALPRVGMLQKVRMVGMGGGGDASTGALSLVWPTSVLNSDAIHGFVINQPLVRFETRRWSSQSMGRREADPGCLWNPPHGTGSRRPLHGLP